MKIELITRQVCPICDEVKSWLRDRQIQFTEYEVGHEKSDLLLSDLTPAPTKLPVCFVDGVFIGGKIEMFRWTVSYVKQMKEQS